MTHPTPDLLKALDHRLPTDTPIGIAISGGPDSLALLLLAHAVRPGQIHAATVDHGLRPESAAEAETVAKLCADRAIPHAILRATWAPAPRIGLQAQARAHRYRLLGAWCRTHGIPLLLTAHHRDDQAETLLMRLARGSGLAGLAGVRETRLLHPDSPVRLLRPLLDVAKADLVAIVAAHGLVAIDDPSNRATRHDRTHARALLAETSWLDAARLAAAARHLADAETALLWVVARESEARIDRTDGTVFLRDPHDLPDELLRRLVLHCLHSTDDRPPPRGIELNHLIQSLKSGNIATLGTNLVRPTPQGWRFEPAPPRRPTRNTH